MARRRPNGYRPRQDGRIHSGDARSAYHRRLSYGYSHVRRKRTRNDRDGLSHRAGASELLGICAKLRLARPHVRTGSLVEPAGASVHGFRVGGRCANIADPSSCKPEHSLLHPHDFPRDLFDKDSPQVAGRPDYPWTDLTYLLHANGVSWAYYVMDGLEPDCMNDQSSCALNRRARERPAFGIRSSRLPTSSKTASSGTSKIRAASSAICVTARCRRSCGSLRETDTANILRDELARAKLTSPA